MFASRVSRILISSLLAGAVLIGCKGHSNSASIPQALTNWIWAGGGATANSQGYYLSPPGTASSITVPSGRYGAMTWWNQNTKQFWVFSGLGGVNDVWKFDIGTGYWTWMAGNTSTTQPVSGTYPASVPGTGTPGQRSFASHWIDSAGNLWMFGGYGIDSVGQNGLMNDMWSFSPATNLWTWYGPLGTQFGGANSAPASATLPGPRQYAANWTVGNTFYLFGGQTNPSGSVGVQNDLWAYNSTTNSWTLINGTQQQNQKGVYQTEGTAASGSQPGARQNATTWVDSSGNLWLFGGNGYDSAGTSGYLNDLWKYSPSTNLWTWVSGSTTVNAIGVYGTNAVGATTNYPGARYASTGWVDSSNNIWIFGGYGINISGSTVTLNDLWEFQPANGQWTWFNGSYYGNVAGYYGTLGLNSTQNSPGARYGAAAFIDTSSGLFWMFGGNGYDSTGISGTLNDVWKFTP